MRFDTSNLLNSVCMKPYVDYTDVTCSSRENARIALKQDVEKFLAAGGKIDQFGIRSYVHVCVYCQEKLDTITKTTRGLFRIFCDDDCRKRYHKIKLGRIL